MVSNNRTPDTPEELPTETADDSGVAGRQHGPRDDPSMRDGNNSHGNPYESAGDDWTTDNDTGDVATEPARAGIDGGAAGGTTADVRPDVNTAARETDDEPIDARPRRNRPAPAANRVVNRPREESRGDRDELPLRGYQHLTVAEVVRRAGSMSADELRRVREFEAGHRRRKTLLAKLDRMLQSNGGAKTGSQEKQAG